MNYDYNMVKVATLARMYDCDKRTMQEVLMQLREYHEIPSVSWNGTERVDLAAFKRAVLKEARLCWAKRKGALC